MANELRFRASIKDDVSSPLERIKDRFAMLQKQGAKGIGIGVGFKAAEIGIAAVQRGLDFLVEGIFSSIDAASNLSETMTKSEQIFGRNADAISAWADTAAGAFGQSKRQALDTASGFAGLFKTVGIQLDQATEYSKRLTVLGSDLASFFNTDVQSALDAIRSGLSGESEPLRRFNVFLSETAVSAKLAQLGIEKVGGQFTEAQKATARYALILEQTQDAQGDFARTSDGLANTQRTLQAQVEDLQASIGEELLPVMVALAGFVRDEVVPTLKDAVAWFKENREVIGTLGEAFGVVVKGPLQSYWDKVHEIEQAQVDAQQSAKELAERGLSKIVSRAGAAGAAVGSIVAGLKRVKSPASAAARSMGDMADEADKARDAVKSMRDIIRGAAETLGEQKYGHEEVTLKIKGNKLELKDLQAELKRLEAIKNPTRDTRQDIIDTRLAIVANKKEAIELQGDLAAIGKVNMSVTKSWVDRLADSLDEAGDEAFYLRQQLAKLGAPGGGGSGGGGGGGGGRKQRASGGPVFSGQSYLVGESGPEILRMGSQGGSILNAQQTAGALRSGASPTVVNINVTGASIITPGAAKALADQIAPAITRWQQVRGL